MGRLVTLLCRVIIAGALGGPGVMNVRRAFFETETRARWTFAGIGFVFLLAGAAIFPQREFGAFLGKSFKFFR